MCGICGYISRQEYNERVLEEMNNTMLHRGPDDGGIYQNRLRDGSFVGLAHRRLSILDLSPAGRQPMESLEKGDGICGSGDYVIVYNGEVYNFEELRNDLIKKGYAFRSHCDTEVILNLYAEYGAECLKMLNGMFGLAILDLKKEELLLARDRMGKKPLYYYLGENGTIAFASELKPLMKFPEFHKRIRTELISSYLVHKCFESPNTVFADTYKVEPGQYVVWKRNEGAEKGFFWNLLETFAGCQKNMINDYSEAKSGLRDLLYDSVEKRLVADVPVGTFLSGGIDSSLVTAVAKEVSTDKVKTFTIGFDTKKENEAEYAKEVAGYLGTDHTELYISEKDLYGQIKDIVRYYDEPFSDSSQIPTMMVSKLARQDITAVLSGDGGDELFCGYTDYDWMLWAQRLDGLGTLGYGILNLPGLKQCNLIDRLPDKLYGFINNRKRDTKLQLFDDVRERYTKDMVSGGSRSSKYEFEKKIHEIESVKRNWQMQRELLDIRYYMADEVLVKTDRASMKYSLECRCPLLDHRIVEYSFRLPQKYKYRSGSKKYILKDLAYEMIPQKLLDRPKKGFGVPLAKWMRGELNSQLLRYADKELLKKQGIFEADKIWEFIGKLQGSDVSLYNSVLWGFFVFQMWYQEYVEDLWGM